MIACLNNSYQWVVPTGCYVAFKAVGNFVLVGFRFLPKGIAVIGTTLVI